MNKENEILNRKPKVTIMVAVYNIEKFVSKCIQSILDQDYKNLEIILVDDCSTDSSGKICDDFARAYSRVLVTHHVTNTRLSGVRNTGLSQATGDYIVFVDGDDWLAPDFVSYMLQVITTTNADMAMSLYHFSTRDEKQIKQEDVLEVWSTEKATAELLYPHIGIGCWNKIYRRDFIERYQLRFRTELFTGEGLRFITDAAQRANHIGIGHRKVYYYRLNNSESATTKPDVRQGRGAVAALEMIKKDLIIRTPYVMNAIQQHLWKSSFWTLRLIIATKSIEDHRELYEKSLHEVKKRAFPVARAEKSPAKKLRFYLTGCFPKLSAHFVNVRQNVGLFVDLKKNGMQESEAKGV